MPTNRPFFANFLAAFRAHSALSKTPTTTAIAPTTNPSSTFSPPTRSAARAMATKSPSQGATTAAVQAATLSHARSPVSRSPPAARSPPSNFRPQRRGSDSSSDGGFRDVLGGEKWYVGGRTATGEERFYKLGMVKKERSGDRLSMDRLSL